MSKHHEPTEALRGIVSRLATMGHTRDVIAKALRITRRTLSAHYATELEEAAEAKNETVERSLFEMATGKEIATGKPIPRVVAAAIFWLKARAGWKEAAQDFNLNGRVVHAGRADLTGFTDAELLVLERILERRDREARAIDTASVPSGDQGGAGAP